MKNYLNFENEIKDIESEIDKLKDPYNNEGISTVDTVKIDKLQSDLQKKLKEIYSKLDPWQTTLVARHEDRPKSKFFIDNLFDNFFSLSGDRLFGEDKSSIAGLANFENNSVLVIGQEKGDDLDSRIERNFGMMRPEGYRKSIRLMKIADKFGLPVIIFIDTPGAYPGVGAEERGQAEAIAKSIECSLSLGVPTISVIIGEGGSGGAIALASSNKILMFENAIYSVISPEGCASILWRDPKKTLEAATAMKLTSKDLLELKIIDEIILEPNGGAHRDREQTLIKLKTSIARSLAELTTMSRQDIIEHRKNKFLNIGRDKAISNNVLSSDNLFSDRVSKMFNVRKKIGNKKTYSFIVIFVLGILSLLIFQLFFR
ncbi:acetyl-CoA carboxylase carboxyltransferase subunit alpha [Candidatus Pelagibacter sp.]|nr:acetyl-CoA carboxylase carboxyltransferase subunit alpha [Candidatus Pelagibacter sp.]